jgi:hypothetical protein
MRYLLEGLGIDLPRYARRRIGGRPPHRADKGSDVVAAYERDNPSYEPLTLAPRKPNATPERMAELAATPEAPSSLGDRIAALKAAQAPHSADFADDTDPLTFLST